MIIFHEGILYISLRKNINLSFLFNNIKELNLNNFEGDFLSCFLFFFTFLIPDVLRWKFICAKNSHTLTKYTYTMENLFIQF